MLPGFFDMLRVYYFYSFLLLDSRLRLLADGGAQDEQNHDGHYDADRQADPCALDEARDDEVDKAYERNGDRVGQLSPDVLNVVAVSAGGGHDGRVGNGGAVVAADSAREAGGDADHQQRIADLEDGQDDGDEDAEGSPARAGRKGQQAGDNEYDRREHVEQARGGGLHNTLNIIGRTKQTGHVLQRDREGQDQDRGNHCIEALYAAAHCVLEGGNAAADEIDNSEYKRYERAPGQADKGVGVAERADKVAGHTAFCIPEAADVHQADNAHDYKNYDGNEHIPQGGLGVLDLLVAAERAEIALESFKLALCHRAVVKAHDDHADDEHEGQQGVEVEGDGLDEKLDAGDARVEILGNAGDCRRPARHRGDHAYGSRGGVDEVCKLCTRDLLIIGQRTHDGADGQAVEVIVDEDQNAEDKGCKQRAGAALDVLCRPLSEGRRRTGGVYQRDHDTENNEEHEDACVIGDRGGEALGYHSVESADRVKARHEQRTDEYADEQ